MEKNRSGLNDVPTAPNDQKPTSNRTFKKLQTDSLTYNINGKNIFTDLRKADKTNADLIIIQGVSTDGLGLAIMNRLLRACNFNIIR